ncbi:LanC-like protein GCL1 [Abeliophyllum distichum]|uniref:LanC-like protein GCL1 n=1 Tax=Abeliophyllum distichum TaxID=126358 RepID=A0ABD1SVU4_9LAMI
MSSSVVKFASQESNNSNHEEGNHELFDKLHIGDPTAPNLSLPADTFVKAAISLKDQVVEVTWKGRVNNEILDPTVYTGLLGTAFTCLRSHEATGNHRDLQLCVEIVDACAAVAHSSTRHVTFLCGRGGIYALGAVAANYCGDQMKHGGRKSPPGWTQRRRVGNVLRSPLWTSRLFVGCFVYK